MEQTLAREIMEDFLGLFFPNYCRACDESLVKGENLICTKCLLELPRSNYHVLRENPFYSKFRGRIPVSFVMTLFKFAKATRVQHLLHGLKYKNQPEIGVALGRLYGDDLTKADYTSRFDLIVPVPLHPLKRRKRGYNQSDEFGKGLAEALAIPCDDSIMRRKFTTATQTKKNRLNRWENVNTAFEVINTQAVAGSRILLVDDVVTTGATLEACGKSLLDAGCLDLSIACIAATQ